MRIFLSKKRYLQTSRFNKFYPKEFYGLIDTNTYINILQTVVKDDNDNIKLSLIDNILIMNNEDLNHYNENVKMIYKILVIMTYGK